MLCTSPCFFSLKATETWKTKGLKKVAWLNASSKTAEDQDPNISLYMHGHSPSHNVVSERSGQSYKGTHKTLSTLQRTGLGSQNRIKGSNSEVGKLRHRLSNQGQFRSTEQQWTQSIEVQRWMWLHRNSCAHISPSGMHHHRDIGIGRAGSRNRHASERSGRQRSTGRKGPSYTQDTRTWFWEARIDICGPVQWRPESPE